MNRTLRTWDRSLIRALCIGLAFALAGCVGYGGYGLKPGVATEAEVISTMGEPAMRWDDPDGRVQLAFPRGPAGLQTDMAFIGPDGRLERFEGVLDEAHFAKIVGGTSDQAAILRLLGPSQPHWSAYFEARNELVWEWRFCDSLGQVARFDVLFDATTGIVRTTYARPELAGRGVVPKCARDYNPH